MESWYGNQEQVATLDDMIENLKRNERTIAYTEPDADKGKDNPKNTYFNDSNTGVFMPLLIGKGYHNYFTICLQLRLQISYINSK